MKVSTFSSVGAKLFYYMSSLVLITVAVTSLQYAKTFSAFMTQQVQDSVQQQAESAAGQIENTLENWRSQIAVALPTLRASAEPPSLPVKADKSAPAKPDGESGLRRFVDANPEFVALELLGAAGPQGTKFTPLGDIFTSNVSDKNFEDKEPAKVWAKIKGLSTVWLKKQVGKMPKKSNVAVESIAKATGLPLMMIAVRFDVADSSQVVWALLVTWQDNLIKALPKGRFTSGSIVDAKGQIFTSPNLADMLSRKTITGPLVRSALSGASPSGFENEYKDAEGHRKLGAFTRLARYELAVLVDTDAEFAYVTLRRNLMSTALWAALFILVAVMFSFFGAAGITKGLRAVTYATGRIAAGDLKYQIPAGSKDEVGALGAAVNNMSRKIVDLMQVQVDKARFEKELETAKIVQSTFFPKQDIRGADVVVTGFYQPAAECGGDLWGHYAVAEGLDFLFIADAMGHGAPAALVTAMAYSTTMTIADIIRSDRSFRDSPSRILGRLNRVIYEAVRGSISMTFFAALIDTNRGEITFANAGHNFPVIIPMLPGDPRAGKATKQAARHGGIQPISLKLRGTPLGMDPDSTFQEQTMELKAGDKLFLFTDGLIECSSPSGEVWGRKHLLERVAGAGNMSAEEMKDEILGQAFGFFAAKPLDDDVTVVVAELRRDWQARTAPHAATVPLPPMGHHAVPSLPLEFGAAFAQDGAAESAEQGAASPPPGLFQPVWMTAAGQAATVPPAPGASGRGATLVPPAPRPRNSEAVGLPAAAAPGKFPEMAATSPDDHPAAAWEEATLSIEGNGSTTWDLGVQTSGDGSDENAAEVHAAEVDVAHLDAAQVDAAEVEVADAADAASGDVPPVAIEGRTPPEAAEPQAAEALTQPSFEPLATAEVAAEPPAPAAAPKLSASRAGRYKLKLPSAS